MRVGSLVCPLLIPDFRSHPMNLCGETVTYNGTELHCGLKAHPHGPRHAAPVGVSMIAWHYVDGRPRYTVYPVATTL